MLEILRNGFEGAKAALTGQTTLTEANVEQAVRTVRQALLEADVHVDVVRAFVAEVKARAIGEVVQTRAGGKQVSAGDHFTKICHEQLVTLMGPSPAVPLTYRRPATVLMLVGLQGVGKTTTCGKLAKYLLAQKRRPLLVGADLQRPAAQEQLRVLAQRVGVPSYAPQGLSVQDLCAGARQRAKDERCDVIVLDTAGRLSIDEALMDQLAGVARVSQPDETLLVVDAMAGQDSLATARGFAARIKLTGFVMTKLDGDARGGAALSLKHMLKAPIKFLGTGEALDKLEPFRAEGLASRILGLGDIVGLMQDFESVVDKRKAEADAKKMLRGSFTFDDFLGQLKTLEKMGSVKDLLAKMPMFGGMQRAEVAKIDDKTFVVMRSMIQSMTAAERNNPKLLTDSRIGRVARGSGRKPEEVRGLLQRFSQMQAMFSQFKGAGGGGMGGLKGLKQMAGGLKGMAGGRPPMMPGMGGGLPGLPSGGVPAGLPGMGGGAGPAGLDLAQLQQMMGGRAPGGAPRPAGKDDAKRKAERKAARKARKKGRR